jgi:hypothetical protein
MQDTVYNKVWHPAASACSDSQVGTGINHAMPSASTVKVHHILNSAPPPRRFSRPGAVASGGFHLEKALLLVFSFSFLASCSPIQTGFSSFDPILLYKTREGEIGARRRGTVHDVNWFFAHLCIQRRRQWSHATELGVKQARRGILPAVRCNNEDFNKRNKRGPLLSRFKLIFYA